MWNRSSTAAGALNTFGFVDAEVDAAIAAIVGTWDRSSRAVQVTALQQLLLDRLPTLPIGYPALATVGAAGDRRASPGHSGQRLAVRRGAARPRGYAVMRRTTSKRIWIPLRRAAIGTRSLWPWMVPASGASSKSGMKP